MNLCPVSCYFCQTKISTRSWDCGSLKRNRCCQTSPTRMQAAVISLWPQFLRKDGLQRSHIMKRPHLVLLEISHHSSSAQLHAGEISVDGHVTMRSRKHIPCEIFLNQPEEACSIPDTFYVWSKASRQVLRSQLHLVCSAEARSVTRGFLATDGIGCHMDADCGDVQTGRSDDGGLGALEVVLKYRLLSPTELLHTTFIATAKPTHSFHLFPNLNR